MNLHEEVKDDAGAASGAGAGAGDAEAVAKAAADKAASDKAAADKVASDKAASDKAAADKAAAEKAAADKGSKGDKGTVPEKYDFQPPKDLSLDEEIVTEFTGAAKELGLSQAQAKKVFDIGVKLTQKQGAAIMAHVDKTRGEWVKAVKEDKEIGGANLEQNLAVAKKAIAAFDTDGELVKFLNSSGAGDNPALIRAFVKIGKAISNDRLVVGHGAPASPSGSVFSYPKSKHAA